MKTFSQLTLSCLLALGLVACSNSSGGGSGSDGASLLGIWVLEEKSPTVIPGYQNHLPVAQTKYSFFEINSSGEMNWQNQGFVSGKAESMKCGEVSHPQQSESSYRYSREFVELVVKRTAGKPGSADSPEKIEKFLNTPCTLKLVSEDKMQMLCPTEENGNDVRTYLRVKAETRDRAIADSQKAVDFVAKKEPEVRSALAGRKYKLIEREKKTTEANGKVTVSIETSEDIEKLAEEESLSDEMKSVLAKKVEFSSDGNTVLVNSKYKGDVKLVSGHDFTYLSLLANFIHSENTADKVIHYITLSGRLNLKKNGFEMVTDATHAFGDSDQRRIVEIARYKEIQ